MSPTPAVPSIPYGAFARYFFPLAFQSASQGLTYPLVAMVASRGPGGPLNLAGLAQSNTVMFMLGTLGFGLVTTGMVFGRTREGFARFRAVTLAIGLLVVALQALMGVPPVARWLFEGLIGLPPSIAQPAQVTLVASIPLQWLFILRIPHQVCLYNAMAAGRASFPTLMRILLTALLALAFCQAGIVGPLWAIVALTLPVALEVEVSRRLAAPFRALLAPGRERPPRRREIFGFNLPLSLGGYLLSLAAMLLGAFIARAPEPERVLPAYFLALGLVTPLAYGATRIQQVVMAFNPPDGRHRRTLVFAAGAGLLLGLLPLAAILPGAAELYYVHFQNLAPRDLPLVRLAALALVGHPLCVALRAHGEGLASLARKPLTVIAGQTVFLAVVLAGAGCGLALGVPGHVIGAGSLILGNLASAGTLRLLLKRVRHRGPVAETSTAAGPLR